MAKKKPDTEVNLGELQEKLLSEYRSTGEWNEVIWNEMFAIMINYARSLVLKATKGKVFLEPEHVSAVATDAAIKIMKRYKEDDDFLIDRSFGGLLRWKVIESLYGDYQEDNHLSLNHIVSEEGGHTTELGDLQTSVGFTNLGNHQSYEQDLDIVKSIDLMKIVDDVLNDFDSAVDSYRLSMMGRVYLLLTMRKSKVRHSMNIFRRYADMHPKEEEALELLLLEVRNRINPTAVAV